jgi:DNA processing protein
LSSGACARCLARSWLLGRLSGHLDLERARIEPLLELGDEELLEAVGGPDRAALLEELQARRRTPPRPLARVESICCCQERYPARLRDLAAPPAALHVAGGLDRFLTAADDDPVAIVGSRRPTAYGLEVARSLARGLAGAGVTVLSGMALGIDAAAHTGALENTGVTVAVLPGGPDRAYPREKRRLHETIVRRGAAVSELADRVGVRRWMFLARNRLIAGLAAMTVVVEAADRSGALVTARVARELDRPLGAVPGRVTSSQASGPNRLLASGAHVVRGPQDVLDVLFGAGTRRADEERRPELSPEQRELLAALAEGSDTPDALARAGIDADRGLAALAELELDGYLRRGPGGRLEVVP